MIDSKALELLPAPGRAAFLMGVTVPTVVATGDTQFNRQQDQTNASLLSLGGGPRRGNNYLVDGLPITDMRNRAVVNPIIESVDEVKVQVHTYDTEMGRTGGGILNVAMKSGTNSYRGTGFFQTRPEGLLEQNFFLKRRNVEKADQYYRLYGGGIGGPVVKDRTFFWAAAEGYRSLTTRNGENRFPTTLERAGNFSQSRDANGNLIVIYDPTNRDANGNRIPFPGNIIPANRIDPVAAAILGYVPQPDSNVSNGQPNHSRQTSITDVADQFTGKVDHKFTDKVSLSGSYIYNKTDEPHSVFWDDNLFGSPSWLLKRRIHMVVVNNTWVQNDTTVFTFRGGMNTLRRQLQRPARVRPRNAGLQSGLRELDGAGRQEVPPHQRHGLGRAGRVRGILPARRSPVVHLGVQRHRDQAHRTPQLEGGRRDAAQGAGLLPAGPGKRDVRVQPRLHRRPGSVQPGHPQRQQHRQPDAGVPGHR